MMKIRERIGDDGDTAAFDLGVLQPHELLFDARLNRGESIVEDSTLAMETEPSVVTTNRRRPECTASNGQQAHEE